MPRYGMVLPVVLVAVFFLALLVFITSSFSKRTTFELELSVQSRQARLIAKAGLVEALAHLRHSSQTCFHDFLKNGDESELTGRSIILFSSEQKKLSPVLEKIMSLLEGSSIAVIIHILESGPIVEKNILNEYGIVRGQTAIRARVRIESCAVYGDATEKVLGETFLRFQDSRFPILSKFTLFLREAMEDGKLNSLEYMYPFDPSFYPLILINGLVEKKVDRAGSSGMSGVIVHPTTWEKKGENQSYLDRQGWIYLGGGKWVLNLTAGAGGPWGEDFHRRLWDWDEELPPEISRAIEKTHESGAPSSYMYKVTHITDSSVNWRLFGFMDFYEVLDADTSFYNPFDPVQRASRIYLEPSTNVRSSLLHLFGTPQEVSPTIVFGDVWARSIIRGSFHLRGMLKRPNWHDPTMKAGVEFDRDFVLRWAATPYLLPDEASRYVFREIMGGDFRLYEKYMSKIQEIPYNRSNNFIYTNTESSTIPSPDHGASYDKYRDKLKNGTEREETPLKLDIRRVSGYTTQATMVDGDIRIRSSSGKEIFRGELSGLPGIFSGDWCRKMTVFEMNGSDFSTRCLKNGRLKLPGFVRITDENPFVFERVDEIISGGVVLFSSDVHIKGPIQKGKDPSKYLAVVSLKGNIIVDTDGTLEVSLLAPEGRITPKHSLMMKGSLLARNLEPIELATPFWKFVRYDEVMDVTDDLLASRMTQLFLAPVIHMRWVK